MATECCTSFIPDGRIFQEMEVGVVYDLNILATVRSTYQCGDGTGPAVDPVSRHLKGSQTDAVDRDLQDGGVVSYVEASFSLTAVEETGCGWNPLCFLMKLIKAILGLFAFF